MQSICCFRRSQLPPCSSFFRSAPHGNCLSILLAHGAGRLLCRAGADVFLPAARAGQRRNLCGQSGGTVQSIPSDGRDDARTRHGHVGDHFSGRPRQSNVSLSQRSHLRLCRLCFLQDHPGCDQSDPPPGPGASPAATPPGRTGRSKRSAENTCRARRTSWSGCAALTGA